MSVIDYYIEHLKDKRKDLNRQIHFINEELEFLNHSKNNRIGEK